MGGEVIVKERDWVTIDESKCWQPFRDLMKRHLDLYHESDINPIMLTSDHYLREQKVLSAHQLFPEERGRDGDQGDALSAGNSARSLRAERDMAYREVWNQWEK